MEVEPPSTTTDASRADYARGKCHRKEIVFVIIGFRRAKAEAAKKRMTEELDSDEVESKRQKYQRRAVRFVVVIASGEVEAPIRTEHAAGIAHGAREWMRKTLDTGSRHQSEVRLGLTFSCRVEPTAD
jgi:hypothetical protein